MVLPGHLGGGYLAAKALLSLLHPAFSAAKINLLLIIGTLAGEFPDIDLIRAYCAGKSSREYKDEDHRNYFTHTPFIWLLISLLVIFFGYVISSSFTRYIGLMILAGSWSHLLLDSIEYGVMWLWPFSKKRYSLIKKIPEANITARPGTIRAHLQFVEGAYLHTWTFWAELAITFVAIIVFFNS